MSLTYRPPKAPTWRQPQQRNRPLPLHLPFQTHSSPGSTSSRSSYGWIGCRRPTPHSRCRIAFCVLFAERQLRRKEYDVLLLDHQAFASRYCWRVWICRRTENSHRCYEGGCGYGFRSDANADPMRYRRKSPRISPIKHLKQA